MSPRTVLVLPGWYPTAQQPLAGPFVRDHTRAAAAYGHRMAVFVDEGPRPGLRRLFELAEERDGPLRVFRFRYRQGAGRAVHLPAIIRLVRRLSRDGTPVDLIHAHIHRMAWPAAIAGGLIRRPFVVTENSSEWPRRTIAPHALRRARRSFPRAALVCPVNRRLREAIEAYGVHGRFRIVPNTVDTAVFNPAGRRADDGSTRLVNVASHLEVKALDVLLRAFARASERRPDLRLEQIGAGPLTADLKALAAELGIDDRVHLAGTATPAEIAESLRLARGFVLSSLSENMPLAVLEALCCGVPVAATDVGGVSEAVGADGQLAPPGDPDALASAILSVVERSFDAEEIARRAGDRFSFQAVGGVWDEIYRSL
jgi:glycosyltransferase involved in cell wall biosynthesis